MQKRCLVSLIVFGLFGLLTLFQSKLDVFAAKVPATSPVTAPHPIKRISPTPTRIPVTSPIKFSL